MIDVLDLFEDFNIVTENNERYVFVASLIDFEYPRCFVTRKDKEFYVFMECENDDEHLCWTVSKTTPIDLNMVNTGKRSVQSLFKTERFEIYLQLLDNKVYSRAANPLHEIKGSFYSPNFGDMDELFDLHGLQSVARLEKENSVSLIFSDDKMGSTSLIFKSINYLRNLIKTLNSPFDIMNTDLKVQHGSTVITFIAKNDLPSSVNLTPDLKPLSTDSFAELGNVLSTNEPEILLSYSKKPKKFLSKYKGIVDSLEKESVLKPKIVLALSEMENAKVFSLDKSSLKIKKDIIKKASDYVKNNIKIQEKDIDVKGFLSGIYSKEKGSFSFETFDGNEYHGLVDIALIDKMNSFIVKGAIYLASIREIVSLVDNNVEHKNYVLKDLAFIENVERHAQLDLFEK